MRRLLERLIRWRERRREIREAAARADSIHELLLGTDFQAIARGRKLRRRSLDNWCAGQHREAVYSWPHQRREDQQ